MNKYYPCDFSFLPPANEVCEGYVFTGVCHSVHGGGACVVARGGVGGGHARLLAGGHVWLLWGVCMVARGGVRGCSRGACVVAPGGVVAPGEACVVALGGHVWLLQGGVRGCSSGGMCGCSRGGMHGCSRGHAWLLWGGMCGCSQGGMRGCSRGGLHGFFDEIRSMSGRYASYWNAFLFERWAKWRNHLHRFSCLDFLINQASRSKNGLQPQLIRYDANVDPNARNRSLMLSLNGP